MMKKLALLLVLCAALAATSAARSQQPDTATASARSGHPRDSVDFEPSPELKKSLHDLAASVQALANRIASDPEIRANAIRVASGLVSTAQQVVTEQSVVLESALKTAAEKIAAAQSSPSTPPRGPR